jgi:mono/diheme cytochrome c family protein
VYEVDVLNAALPVILAAGDEAEPAAATGSFGIGAIVLVVVVVSLLAWMAYLFLNSRRSRSTVKETPPPNQTPYMSDAELENVRTTKVLRAAVFAAATLALIIPAYAFAESNRQADAADDLVELAIEEGEHWFNVFACSSCHGPQGGGGAAAFTEARSGVDVSWQVPSLNDVLYRFDREEIQNLIVYGREGTPMPASGLDGGGAMTVQEVDHVIDFLASIQIPQVDVVAGTESTVSSALNRIAQGDEATQALTDRQQAEIDDVLLAPDQLAVAGDLGNEIRTLLGGDGSCTEASAAVILTTCPNPAPDADRDGLSDGAEPRLTEISAIAYETLTELLGLVQVEQAVYDVAFDPANAYTNTADDRPIPDLDEAQTVLSAIEADLLLIRVTADKQDDFLADLESGLGFLERSADAQLWLVDFDEVASEMSDQAGVTVSVGDAERAVGLFNGYCARCHTGGYSAGSTFEIGAGRGAWGPAINDGRSIAQFPSIEDQVDFIIAGTNANEPYGVNGLGTGRMPGFGASLSEADIELISLYERTM